VRQYSSASSSLTGSTGPATRTWRCAGTSQCRTAAARGLAASSAPLSLPQSVKKASPAAGRAAPPGGPREPRRRWQSRWSRPPASAAPPREPRPATRTADAAGHRPGLQHPPAQSRAPGTVSDNPRSGRHVAAWRPGVGADAGKADEGALAHREAVRQPQAIRRPSIPPCHPHATHSRLPARPPSSRPAAHQANRPDSAEDSTPSNGVWRT
jgi:hypothetical protein